jgi:oligosaccharide repeat unit polymerase
MILKAYPQLLFSLGSSAAQRLRADVGTQQEVMSGAPIILSGMVWWAVFKMRRTELIVKKRLSITRVVIAISIILLTLTFFIKMSRMELIPLFVGLLINYKYAEYVTFKGGRTDLLRSMVVVIVIGLAIFIVLSLLRGYGDWQEIFRQMFAYGPASYNRLSAFLSGRLHFHGENTGIYVSSFQGQIPILKHFVDIYSLLGQPNLNSAWLRDFEDVAQSGLNPKYTFPTVYGAVYSFFGLLSPIYFVAIGLFFKQVVHSINKEKIFGIVFFPFVLLSMLFLFGWNFVLSYNFIVLVITVFILFSYEVVFWSIAAHRHHNNLN